MQSSLIIFDTFLIKIQKETVNSKFCPQKYTSTMQHVIPCYFLIMSLFPPTQSRYKVKHGNNIVVGKVLKDKVADFEGYIREGFIRGIMKYLAGIMGRVLVNNS